MMEEYCTVLTILGQLPCVSLCTRMSILEKWALSSQYTPAFLWHDTQGSNSPSLQIRHPWADYQYDALRGSDSR
jgi:hypothetical protein